MPVTTAREPGRVAIACQGGGSHTAFTAGVLQRLLSAEELARYQVVGLSGASGGAICALLAWCALRDGDRAAAGERLRDFWMDNAARGPLDRVLNAWLVSAGVLQSLDVLPSVSPYTIPRFSDTSRALRKLLAEHIDFDGIEADLQQQHPLLERRAARAARPGTRPATGRPVTTGAVRPTPGQSWALTVRASSSRSVGSWRRISPPSSTPTGVMVRGVRSPAARNTSAVPAKA